MANARHHDLVDHYRISVLQITVCRNHGPVISSLSYNGACKKSNTYPTLVEQELTILQEHMSYEPPIYSRDAHVVRVFIGVMLGVFMLVCYVRCLHVSVLC